MIHITRLWFERGRGLADHAGVTVVLGRVPPVTAQTAEIDYSPGLRSRTIRDQLGGWRDMLDDEIERAKDMLDRMAAAAVRELEK